MCTVYLQLSHKGLVLSSTLHAGSGRHSERAHLMPGSTAAGYTRHGRSPEGVGRRGPDNSAVSQWMRPVMRLLLPIAIAH